MCKLCIKYSSSQWTVPDLAVKYLPTFSNYNCRSQCPRGLWRGSAAAGLLGLRVRIPPGGIDICLLWVSYFVRWRSLGRADHSSRGVLPNVIVKPRYWGGPDPLGAVAPGGERGGIVTVKPVRHSDLLYLLPSVMSWAVHFVQRLCVMCTVQEIAALHSTVKRRLQEADRIRMEDVHKQISACKSAT
jgi:hypothetical protein